MALLLFVIFHILHLTHHHPPAGQGPSPYENVVGSFEIWWVTLIYVRPSPPWRSTSSTGVERVANARLTSSAASALSAKAISRAVGGLVWLPSSFRRCRSSFGIVKSGDMTDLMTPEGVDADYCRGRRDPRIPKPGRLIAAGGPPRKFDAA